MAGKCCKFSLSPEWLIPIQWSLFHNTLFRTLLCS